MREIKAAQGDDVDMYAMMRTGLAITPDALSLYAPNGRLLCILGTAPYGGLLTTSGVPWLLGTNAVRRFPKALMQVSRAYLADVRERYSMLFNYVDARNTESLRYLKALGFEFDPAQPYGVNGEPFHRFSWSA